MQEGIKWCPKCGDYSFSYDGTFKAYRCFKINCSVGIDYEGKYGKGLDSRPEWAREKARRKNLEGRV